MRWPTPKKVTDEFRSRRSEAVIVDMLVGVASAALIAVPSLLIHFASSYIPSISAYLEPGLPLVFGVVYSAVAVGMLVYYSTNRGRKSRLIRLLRLLRQYGRFNHTKEMEVVSRIHSRTQAAALVFLFTSLLATPLLITITYFFAVAIIADITNNVKGTHIHPSFGPKLLVNGYGIVLGLSFFWIFQLLESARSESLLLSAKYRRKMIDNWRSRIAQLKPRIRKRCLRDAAQKMAAPADSFNEDVTLD